MLKIRLQRVGRKNDPSFRVIITDSRHGPRSARYVEMVGSHNPKQHTTVLNGERILYWIGQGAQVSGTVHNMLVTQGIVKGKKINVLPRKTPIAKEKGKEEVTADIPAKEETVTEKTDETSETGQEPKPEPTSAEEEKK